LADGLPALRLPVGHGGPEAVPQKTPRRAEMRQSPEQDAIEKRLGPGKTSRDGFLGTDTRHLGEIIVEDDLSVKRLDLTHAAIVDRMRFFRDAAEEGFGGVVMVPPHFEVRSDSVRGKISCPFGHQGGGFAKNTVIVENTRLNKQVMYTDLTIHLIEAHGFYQGRGAYFRTDPAVLAEVLEVERLPPPAMPQES